MDYQKILKENLKVIENQWFESQKKMGESLGVSPGAINSYVKGDTTPPLKVLILLERMTGITISVLSTSLITSDDLPKIPFSKKIEFHSMNFNEPGERYNTEKELQKLKMEQRLEIVEKTQMLRAERIAELEKRLAELEKQVKKDGQK